MSENNEKFYNTKKAALQVGVSDATIKSAIKRGELPAKQIASGGPKGYSYMVSETDLITWMDTRKQRKTTIAGVTEMTVDDLANEILKRLKHEYERGYKQGKKDAKEEFMKAFKGVKL